MQAKPAAARGFEKVHRYWDSAHQRWTAKVLPGGLFVSEHDESMTTVLGSCISACLRDPLRRLGGMNHFMLPAESGVEMDGRGRPRQSAPRRDAWSGAAERYGSFAMESLINELLKLGARRERLTAKIFGGGRILASATDVGAQNIAFVREFLRIEGLSVLAEDVGDIHPRRVIFFPHSGLALVKRLPALEGTVIAQREADYGSALSANALDDDVELFG